MFYIVYKTTNQVNGKFYIGTHKTVDLNDNYLGSGALLKRAIKKYGIENFKKEILFVFDNPEDMFAKEAEIVTEEFLSENNTYNLKKGGFGGFDHINENKLNGTEKGVAVRQLLSQNEDWYNFWKERQQTGYLQYIKNVTKDEWSRRSKKANQTCLSKYGRYSFEGRLHTAKSKKAIGDKNSKHQTGSGNSQFGTMWITNGIKNSKIKKEDNIPIGWSKGRSQLK